MTTIGPDTTHLRPTTQQGLAMIAGPALLLAGFAVHPADEGSPAEVLRQISEHRSEWVASHLLLFAAAVMLIPAVLTLGRLVTGRQRKIAAVASGLVVFASVGLAGSAALEQLVGVAAGLSGDAAAMARLIEVAEKSTVLMATFLLPQLAVVLGFLMMAWALFRSGVVPTWAAALMGIGAVGVMAPEPGRCIAVALLLTTFAVALRRSRSGADEVALEITARRSSAMA